MHDGYAGRGNAIPDFLFFVKTVRVPKKNGCRGWLPGQTGWLRPGRGTQTAIVPASTKNVMWERKRLASPCVRYAQRVGCSHVTNRIGIYFKNKKQEHFQC